VRDQVSRHQFESWCHPDIKKKGFVIRYMEAMKLHYKFDLEIILGKVGNAPVSS